MRRRTTKKTRRRTRTKKMTRNRMWRMKTMTHLSTMTNPIQAVTATTATTTRLAQISIFRQTSSKRSMLADSVETNGRNSFSTRTHMTAKKCWRQKNRKTWRASRVRFQLKSLTIISQMTALSSTSKLRLIVRRGGSKERRMSLRTGLTKSKENRLWLRL